MIVDTSAILAILFGESDADRYDNAIARASFRRMSVASYVEAAIVLESRLGLEAGPNLDAYLIEAKIELEPVTPDQVVAARRAWRRFGKGNHPASLNFGDCFAYAIAETTGERLLFKGRDFEFTDVESAPR